jgi:predicted metal-binding membrane protein
MSERTRPLKAGPGSGLALFLKRDRVVVLVALSIITALAWLYLWLGATPMRAVQPMSGAMTVQSGMPAFAQWSSAHAISQFAMWAVMMVGMMTPTVAPVVLLYSRVADQAPTRKFAPPMWFVLGYLMAWTAFAMGATASQWALERAALLTPMLASANRYFGGAILLAAGAYQWSPFKVSCLSRCRAPLSFIQQHGGFKPAITSSVRLGLLHGAYCIGCCWALMTLLFLAGVMNFLWIAAIMILVLLEKLAPQGGTIARVAGAGAIVAGAWMLATG